MSPLPSRPHLELITHHLTTHSELFATGEVSAQDESGLDSFSQEEQVAGAAVLSGLALLLVILGLIACVVLVVLVAATTTGVLVYKKRMYDISSHAFEGTIVSERSVPVGAEIAPPSWSTEAGGSGSNPAWGNDLRQSVTSNTTENPIRALEMHKLTECDGNAIPEDFGEKSSDY